MSAIVDKKINAFERYMRQNYKRLTAENESYEKVYEIDHEPFLVFYLKILLEYINNIRKKTKPVVSEAVPRKLRPGTRSSIPFPKEGLAAMKTGVLPDLNLVEIIDTTIDTAIRKYYEALKLNKDLNKQLSDHADNTENISLEELMSIVTNPNSEIIPNRIVSKVFDIRDYLKEKDAKLIYREIRENIVPLHNNVTTFICNELSDPENIRIVDGILPLLYADTILTSEELKKFNEGKGVAIEFIVKEEYDATIKGILDSGIIHDALAPYFVRAIDDQQIIIFYNPE